MRRDKRPIALHLRSGVQFELRRGDLNNDYGVAYEVFVLEYYADHHRRLGKVELVVDLGVNVGYSTLYFVHKWPGCQVLGFEPHPAHFAQAKRNLELDESGDRVELHNVAIGSTTRKAMLTDRMSASALAEEGEFEVDVIDVFPLLEGKRIDLLKMDIEGGEYELLADPRFTQLDIGAVVMEWHCRNDWVEDKRWCEQRLRGSGFAIEEIFAKPNDTGMLWAFREAIQ
jgi:FkbM family methyltransferase